MLSLLKKIAKWKRWIKPEDLDALIDRVNLLSKIQGVGGTKIYCGPTGVHVKGGEGDGGTKTKIYEVQSSDTGDGVYNCYEQKVDATYWESTTEVDKLVDKDAVTVEVWNAQENYVYDINYPREYLGIGDRLLGWKSFDDNGTGRIVGVPITGSNIRLAITTEAAPAADTITCNLLNHKGVEITSGLGSGMEVYCNIVGGTTLNNATPRLADNQVISVFNVFGFWYCSWVFQTGHVVRSAFVKTTPGAAATVDCYLDTDASGTQVTVTCEIHGGSALNAAFPRIVDGDMISVYCDSAGTWRCCTTFNYSCEAATETCV